MSDKCSWFSSDVDTGDVVAKTIINGNGTVNRYEYTKSDNIKEGHGHKWYDSVDDFMNDNPSGSRDKNSEDSVYRYWSGNGYDLGLQKIEENAKKLILKRF